MKVLLAYAPGELRVVEMEKPVPGPREVLCKVAHCGVCATDIAIMKGVLNLGASVFKGAYTGYTKGFMPVHVELRYEKDFDLGEIQLPLGVSFMVNPYNRCCYAAAWAGIAF